MGETKRWMRAAHVGLPNAIVSTENPRLNLLGIDQEGYAIFIEKEDAILATAAPTLLAACREAERWIDETQDDDDEGAQEVKANLRAAIQAATEEE